MRARLEPAIAAVGRLESTDEKQLPFLGTAFAVGPDLIVTTIAERATDARLRVRFGDGPTEIEPIPLSFAATGGPWPGVSVMRAVLPDGIVPLRLATIDPAELDEREIALIGYASGDARNDPAQVRRIFGAVLDRKRVMPGRVMGYTEEGRLRHDCSSTGGCGGAPLVDIGTGEVVGIHTGGIYLSFNEALSAWDLAADADVVAAGVAFTGRGRAPSAGTATASAEEPAPRVAADVAPETAAEIPASRPALVAEHWHNELDELDDAWQPLLEPHELRLRSAVRAVAKVVGDGSVANGTAFVVGDRLAITASFVSEPFTDGAGLQATIKTGMQPVLDFGDVLGLPDGAMTVRVTGVKLVHPYFHVALLELEALPDGVTSLELAASLPSELSGRSLALVSFAGAPALQRGEVYAGRWGRVFVQPGQAVQLGQLPDDSGVPALMHDCSDAAGSAGGPLGRPRHGLRRRRAHPRHLRRRLRAAGVGAGARPVRLGLRRRLQTRPAPLVARPLAYRSAPGPPLVIERPARWVDEVPIDWSRAESQTVERLLVASIDYDQALYTAENVGIPLGLITRTTSPQLLWRELLKQAALRGLLRLFIERLAADYEGLAPQLRAHL